MSGGGGGGGGGEKGEGERDGGRERMGKEEGMKGGKQFMVIVHVCVGHILYT